MDAACRAVERTDRPEVAALLMPPLLHRGVTTGLHEAGIRTVNPVEPVTWAQDCTGIPVAVLPDDETALALLADLHASAPQLRSVVLVRDDDLERLSQVLSLATATAGVASDLGHLVAVVAAAARGFTLLNRRLVDLLIPRHRHAADRPHLSEPELRRLNALAAGATIGSLATAEGYSEREMYRLLAQTYERLGCTGRTEALLRADRLGLLQAGA